MPFARADQNYARIIGEVSDGSSFPRIEPQEIPNLNIEKTSVLNSKIRKVILQRVTDPKIKVLPKLHPRPSWNAENKTLKAVVSNTIENAGEKTLLVMVSATVYDHKCTFVRWTIMSQEGRAEEFEAWSNLDFHLFSGFTSYEVDGIQFGLSMGICNSSDTPDERKFLRSAPPLAEGKASFSITKGNRKNRDAVTLIRGLHELYETEGHRLKRAYQGRERARVAYEEKTKNSLPKPNVVTIRYWLGSRKGGAK